jgi:oxygen-independent coproporphyrinogen III oxidase
MAGVYISFPFCAQKCTYCNFASGVSPADLEHRYHDALLREISAHAWAWDPDTLYLGGGTPSRIHPGQLRTLTAAIPGSPWKEATIEAAPGSFDETIVEGWISAGINRVSLGVQSFVRRELAQTGRKHTAETVLNDMAVLRRAGLSNVNIDLIAGLPHQTRESWNESLDWIERLAPPHGSVYMLEVDADSRLGLEIIGGGARYGAGNAPSDELTADLYETAVDRLAALGIHRYEISNFAQPGFESEHNLKYWRLEPYAGFGADAHSFDGSLRWQNAEDAADYIDRIAAGRSPREETTPANHDEEQFFVGLRLTRGIQPGAEALRRYQQPIRQFIEDGLLEQSGDTLRLTRAGVLLSNEVFSEFITP